MSAEHIALEIQTLRAWIPVRAHPREQGKGRRIYVVFSYMEEDAGVYAKAAVRIAHAPGS